MINNKDKDMDMENTVPDKDMVLMHKDMDKTAADRDERKTDV